MSLNELRYSSLSTFVRWKPGARSRVSFLPLFSLLCIQDTILLRSWRFVLTFRCISSTGWERVTSSFSEGKPCRSVSYGRSRKGSDSRFCITFDGEFNQRVFSPRVSFSARHAFSIVLGSLVCHRGSWSNLDPLSRRPIPLLRSFSHPMSSPTPPFARFLASDRPGAPPFPPSIEAKTRTIVIDTAFLSLRRCERLGRPPAPPPARFSDARALLLAPVSTMPTASETLRKPEGTRVSSTVPTNEARPRRGFT